MPRGAPRRIRRRLPRRPAPVEPRVHHFHSPQWPRYQPVWLEHQESAGRRGPAQPHPATAARNFEIAPTGDCPGIGHRDSPAQLGGHGGLFGAQQGIAATDSSRTRALNRAGEARRLTARGKSAAAWALLLLVRFYITFLSPFFGGACRFHPSCCNYAAEAIARHGAARGLYLSLRRLLRCNPFTKGGFDPVPEELPCEPLAHLPRAQGKPQ